MSDGRGGQRGQRTLADQGDMDEWDADGGRRDMCPYNIYSYGPVCRNGSTGEWGVCRAAPVLLGNVVKWWGPQGHGEQGLAHQQIEWKSITAMSQPQDQKGSADGDAQQRSTEPVERPETCQIDGHSQMRMQQEGQNHPQTKVPQQ